jgi:hypothetical protein
MPELKIGSKVDIIFDDEIMKSRSQYMQASVYDREGSKITLSQTSPRLGSNFLGRRLKVTFLVKKEKRVLRFGFPAKLIDLISDYEIASGKKVGALIIEQMEEPEQVEFRMYFRVKPYLHSNISLVWKGNKVNLIDISLGGAKFSCPEEYLLPPADPLKLKLTIGNAVFNLMASICSKGTPYDPTTNGKELQYVSVKFEHDNKQLEASLGKAIIDMERQMLSQGKV